VLVAKVRFVGQLITGGSVSLTDTINEHERELPLLSVAVQLTGVTPSWKTDPDWGVQM
jgi:hypothetical protein